MKLKTRREKNLFADFGHYVIEKPWRVPSGLLSIVKTYRATMYELLSFRLLERAEEKGERNFKLQKNDVGLAGDVETLEGGRQQGWERK